MFMTSYCKFLLQPNILGWTEVRRGVWMEYDLEAHPLQIKTDSLVGSEEDIDVELYTVDDVFIGAIFLGLIDYSIGDCNRDNNYSEAAPVEQEKIWTITKTDTMLKIDCNGVGVLALIFSDSEYTECAEQWSQDVKKIQFSYVDEASDEYRPIIPSKLTSHNWVLERDGSSHAYEIHD